jgi:hypothetical protein
MIQMEGFRDIGVHFDAGHRASWLDREKSAHVAAKPFATVVPGSCSKNGGLSRLGLRLTAAKSGDDPSLPHGQIKDPIFLRSTLSLALKCPSPSSKGADGIQ